jgi:hypothetical protein
MQITDVWHKLDLHRAKITLVFFLLMATSADAQSWLWARKNNPNYDEKRVISYGFLIGLHTSSYQLKYSDAFVTPQFDTVHSIVSDWRSGFTLGFLVNYRIHEVLDLRITPSVAFYEHALQYRYTDKTSEEQLVETTMVEFPMLLKYKSSRRGNVRMYMVGGFKPAIEASGKKDVASNKESLEVKTVNLNIEAGIGFDLYFPLFKFSPEIRFSRGLTDILDNKTNLYGSPLQRLNTNTVNVYLIFQ